MAAGLRRHPQVGVLIPTREAVLNPAIGIKDIVELTREVEWMGFDSVWVGESIIGRPRPDAISLLGAMATVTNIITLGTAALLPALRNPILTAHALATIDHLAEGRLIVGVGSGFANEQTHREAAALGMPYQRRFSATVEAVRCWKTLWRGDECTSHTELWDFEDVSLVPQPTRPEGPPIWLGGASTATLRRVGEHFDGWIPTSHSPADFSAGIAHARSIAAKHERPPNAIRAAAVATIAVTDGRHGSRQLEAFLQRYYATNAPLDTILKVVGGTAGTVDDCAHWLATFVEAGAEHLVVRLAAPEPFAAIRRHGHALLDALKGLMPLPHR